MIFNAKLEAGAFKKYEEAPPVPAFWLKGPRQGNLIPSRYKDRQIFEWRVPREALVELTQIAETSTSREASIFRPDKAYVLGCFWRLQVQIYHGSPNLGIFLTCEDIAPVAAAVIAQCSISYKCQSGQQKIATMKVGNIPWFRQIPHPHFQVVCDARWGKLDAIPTFFMPGMEVNDSMMEDGCLVLKAKVSSVL